MSHQLDEEMIKTLERENNLKPIDEDPRLEPKPVAEDGFANFVVVNNIPVVASDKYDRLLGLLKKLFGVCGTIVDIYMPYKLDNSTTNGFAIIEFSKDTEAKSAIAKYDKYVLDKSHTFKVVTVEALESASKVADEFKEPEIKVPERPDTKTWMTDNRAIDQYLITCVDKIEVCWNTADRNKLWNDTNQKKPELIYEMNKQRVLPFDRNRHEFSPLGNYIASILYDNGVMISVLTSTSNQTKKDGMKLVMKFPHQGVQRILFSPKEKYLVTVSENGKVIKVWEVLSGKNVLLFKGQEKAWPPLFWSFDDSYFATLEEDKIIIYDTSKMEVLENKILKVPGVTKFSWSPTSNLLAYFIPEQSGRPASVSLMEIPSRNIIKAHSIFEVKNVFFEWHPQGEFLGIKIDREVKNKEKGKKNKKQQQQQQEEDEPVDELKPVEKEPEIVTKYDFIKLKEKGLPIVQLDTKEIVLAFSYEKEGSRFAIIHKPLAKKEVANSNNSLSVSAVGKKPNVSFYKISSKGVNHLVTLDNRPAKYIFFSNADGIVALVGDKTHGYPIEFYNLTFKETLANANHQNAQVFSWDPTGRYFVSGVSLYDINTENGFFLWSFDGKLLQKNYKDGFLGLQWRPRPPTPLTKEMEKRITKDFQTYVQKYRDQDNLIQKNSRREFYEQRSKVRKEFYSWYEESLQEYHSNLDKLKGLVSHFKEDTYQNVEVVVEEIISITESDD